MTDFSSLVNKAESVFESEDGKLVYRKIFDRILGFGLTDKIKKGIVIGFSGGADSVLLLVFLHRLSKEWGFPIHAIHVNHNIRGEEALRDASFAESFADALGVEFHSFSVDIPALSKERKTGLEETARNERYRIFEEFIKNNDEVSTIAVAHNATDNAETFIFNFTRGCGLKGLTSIPTVRDSIIRPMLSVSKKDIVKLLNEANIPFVTDSTNFSCDYSRNYIRGEILPRLERLTPDVDRAVSKVISSVSRDEDYLSKTANDFITSQDSYAVNFESLVKLHDAILSRVIIILAKEKRVKLQSCHVDKIISLLRSGENFSYDLPGGFSFFKSFDSCFVAKKEAKSEFKAKKLSLGTNSLNELGIEIIISNEPEVRSSNVYKFSTQALISSDIIIEDLYVRTKKDGDSYKYGGITRKLKKLFVERKIPEHLRNRVPVICDSQGIVLAGGFQVRDSARPISKSKHDCIYITILSNYKI